MRQTLELLHGIARPDLPAAGLANELREEQAHFDDFVLPARYELVEKLGQGGFGVVLLAVDTHLKRRVAIKLLSPICCSPNAW